jgi:hypothetical protein
MSQITTEAMNLMNGVVIVHIILTLIITEDCYKSLVVTVVTLLVNLNQHI